MQSLRSFCRAHAWMAALAVTLALALKALIPAGYMISSASGFAIVPCPAVFAPAPEPAPAHHHHHAMAGHAGMAHHAAAPASPSPSNHGDHAAAQQACPYAVLSSAFLAGADPVLLAAALAFVLALWLISARPLRLSTPPHVRPPLRGPPSAV